MKLSTKVAAVSLLPIVGLAGFAAEQVRGAWTRLLEANRVAEIVVIAPWVGSLVHELQKERGSSSTFAASKGATFADIVPKQRATTDQALATYTRNVSALAATREGPLAAALTAAGQSLNGIPSLRQNVDKYSISGPEVARAYTAAIGQLMAVLNLLPTLTDERTIARAGIGYTAIVSAKEFAGLERATGSRGFSAGRFSPEDYTLYARLFGMQNEQFGLARAVSAKRQVAELERFLTTPANTAAERFREAAKNSLATGALAGVDANSWWATSTARIDALQALEQSFARALQEATELVSSQATTRVIWSAIIGLAVALIAALLLFIIGRSALRDVHGLLDEMLRLSQGDTSVKLAGIARQDEIGEMSRAVSVFRDTALQRIQLEAEMMAEAERKAANQHMLENLVNGFRDTVSEVLKVVEGSAERMTRTGASLGDIAAQASQKAQGAVDASNRAAGAVDVIATATDQLGRQSARSPAKPGVRARSSTRRPRWPRAPTMKSRGWLKPRPDRRYRRAD